MLEKANMILTVSYLMGTTHLFFMCHMLPEVMHESWVENIDQVFCHIFFRNITKLNFLESQLLSTSLEFEIGRKNVFRTVHAYLNSTGLIVYCVYIFFREWKISFSILFRSPF
jgi:hypothetical protein